MFTPGSCDQAGVDAAVVEITDREPTGGDFIWVSPESQEAAGKGQLFNVSLLDADIC